MTVEICVRMLGWFIAGGYVLVNVSYVVSIMNLFRYPLVLFIMNGFVIRVAELRGAYRFKSRLNLVNTFTAIVLFLQVFLFMIKHTTNMQN